MPVPTQPQTPDEMVIRNEHDDAIKVERDSESHSPPRDAQGRRHGGPREAIGLRADQVHGRVRLNGTQKDPAQPQSPPDFHSSTRNPNRPADAKAAAMEGVVHQDTVNTENDPRAVRAMNDEAKNDTSAPGKPRPTGASNQESSDSAAVERAASRIP